MAKNGLFGPTHLPNFSKIHPVVFANGIDYNISMAEIIIINIMKAQRAAQRRSELASVRSPLQNNPDFPPTVLGLGVFALVPFHSVTCIIRLQSSSSLMCMTVTISQGRTFTIIKRQKTRDK